MHLRRLDLVGFKSFANRTTFVFERGISVMCGPNGSGKSNVADAVRWSMGEQSARAIRGRKGEDVIFVGSQGRQPLGLAEVSLTLDNSDGRIPLEFDEVKITRRLYRSGEADYLVNGSKVRLRDIHQWLQHAALDADAYVVVGQGSVDELILQRPEERRIVIDNAADIRRHQSRVAETRSRLAATEENLLRCRAVVAELEPHVTRLRAQAERAERARICREELTILAGRWFRHALRDARGELDRARREAEVLRRAAEQQESALSELEGQTRAAEQATQAAEAVVGELEPRLAAAQAEVARLGQELARADERLRGAGEIEARLSAELERLRERKTALRHEQAQHEARLQEARIAAGEAEQAVANGVAADRADEQTLRRAQEEVTAARRRLAAADTELRTSAGSLEDARSRIERLERRRTRLAEDVERLTIDAEAARVEAAARAADAERCAAELRSAREGRDSLTRERDDERRTVERLRADQHRLAGQRQRLEIAREALRDAPGGQRDGAAAILKKAGLTGLRGPLGGELSVPEPLQTAIGAALGESVRALLADDASTVERAIEAVGGRDVGRLGLLMATDADQAVAGVTDFQQAALMALSGLEIIGFANAQVTLAGTGAALTAAMLGRTIVVRDLAQARKAGKVLQGADSKLAGWQVVTLDGVVLRATGEWWVGRDRAGERLVGRQRERERLDREAEVVQSRLADVERGLAEAAARQGALDRRERALTDARNGAEAADRRAALAAHTAATQASRLERELGEAQAAGPAGDRDLERAHQHVKQADDRHAEAGRRQVAAVAALARSEEASLAETARLEERRAAHATRRIELAARRTEAEGAERLLARAAADTDAAVKAVADGERRLAAEQARTADQTQVAHERRLALEAAEAAVAPLQAELVAARAARQQARERRVGVEQQSNELRALVRGRRTAVEAAAIAESRAGDRLERVQREAQEYVDDLAGPDEARQLRLNLSGAPDASDTVDEDEPDDRFEPDDAFDPDAARRRMTALRRELRAIGDVGEATLAEFRELSSRHAFLIEQMADLERADAELRLVMDELTLMMREAFDVAFARVNLAFGEYFARLFAGGHAELILSRPDDVLESGVDIVARPPGKRLQPLVSLSGGERAMTMIALIFALLKTNPAPFCVLDEVDAALDESNVRRFTSVLRELSERTQFVVVSHNRATMETAEALYGISMDTHGVSTVVSLKLPAEARSQESGERSQESGVRSQ
jgi:chromosome segregation protein